MSRYIDADKLFLNFNDWAFAESPDERHSDVPEYSEHKIHEMIYRTINEAMSAIEQQPTADVIPLEWIKEQKDKCFPYSVTAITLNDLLTEWERREDAEAVNTNN